MSQELNKGDNWYKTVQLATSEIYEVKKKYFDRYMEYISQEQFEKCNKEIQVIYDKYGIQRDGCILKKKGKIDKPKEDGI